MRHPVPQNHFPARFEQHQKKARQSYLGRRRYLRPQVFMTEMFALKVGGEEVGAANLPEPSPTRMVGEVEPELATTLSRNPSLLM